MKFLGKLCPVRDTPKYMLEKHCKRWISLKSYDRIMTIIGSASEPQAQTSLRAHEVFRDIWNCFRKFFLRQRSVQGHFTWFPNIIFSSARSVPDHFQTSRRHYFIIRTISWSFWNFGLELFHSPDHFETSRRNYFIIRVISGSFSNFQIISWWFPKYYTSEL